MTNDGVYMSRCVTKYYLCLSSITPCLLAKISFESRKKKKKTSLGPWVLFVCKGLGPCLCTPLVSEDIESLAELSESRGDEQRRE